jgi:Tfp pilus assembly protein PilE
MKHKILSMLLGCSLIVACSDSDKADNFKIEYISETPKLRESLSPDALLYARFPNLWSIFNADNNAIEKAQGHPEHVAQIKVIQQAISDNLLSHLQSPVKELAQSTLLKLNAPIELAILPNKVDGMPAPIMLLQTQLNYQSVAQFNQELIDNIPSSPGFGVYKDATNQAAGSFSAMMVQGHYLYNEQDKSLKIAIGVGLAANAVEEYFNKKAVQHPMHSIEGQVDSGRHQGLFIYSPVAQVLTKYKQMLNSEQLQMLNDSGLSNMKSAAIGYGTHNDKGRLKVVLETPTDGWREYLPVIHTDALQDISTRGEVHWATKFALPTDKYIESLAQKLQTDSGTTLKKWTALKQQFQSKTNTSLDDWLNALGNDLYMFEDEVGTFLALHAKDKQKLLSLIAAITKDQPNSNYKTKQISNGIIHEVNIELNLYDELDSTNINMNSEVPPWVMELISNSQTHLYFQEEENYLVFASIPQLLMERNVTDNKTSLKQWLQTSQKLNWDHTALGVSGRYDNIAKSYYVSYISVMQYIADSVDAKAFDIYSLPTAKQLNLPKQGGFGLTADLAAQQISFELVFDINPIEYLAQGNMTATMTTVGILAAIAIPAYQDYIDNSQTAKYSHSAQTIKSHLDMNYQLYGSLYTDETTSQSLELLINMPELSVELNKAENSFVLRGNKNNKFYDNWVSYTAVINEDGLDWSCETDLGKSVDNKCTFTTH